MFSSLLFWICVLKVAAAFPQGVFLGKDGTVGASFGGYSASAGLGGLLGGAGTRGGLHAQAGTPDGHFAAAGLGGSVGEGSGTQGHLYSTAGHAKPAVVVSQPLAPVAPIPAGGSHSQASSSASSSTNFQGGITTTGNKRPGTFFDDIFNIPIQTLGAVNQYLNNRNKVAAVPAGVVRVQPVQGSHSNTYASASASSPGSSSASSSANSGAGAGVSNGIENSVYYQKNPNYNDIFNIPISVLGAVNRFLNGK